jgi:hypothetical protein
MVYGYRCRTERRKMKGISAKERYLVRKEQMVSPKLLNADKYDTWSDGMNRHNYLLEGE